MGDHKLPIAYSPTAEKNGDGRLGDRDGAWGWLSFGGKSKVDCHVFRIMDLGDRPSRFCFGLFGALAPREVHGRKT